MSSGDTFDIYSAWMRKSNGDMRAFLEAFAVRLEQSLPGMVQVHRKRDGLFGKTQHVSSISLQLGSFQFILERDAASVRTSRTKVVRGITLKSDELSLADWLAAVDAELKTAAADAEKSHSVLREFLVGE
jgi:hypothetical protein